jgi:hypothetical protein
MHLLAPLDVAWPRPFKQIMALTAGTRLGHYNVTALIGEGGHGPGLASYRHPAQPTRRAEDSA